MGFETEYLKSVKAPYMERVGYLKAVRAIADELFGKE